MDKQQAHLLLDQLGPAQFDAVVKLLEVLVQVDDDEELTREERSAIEASREYFRQNTEGGVSLEQVAADCGFTMEQVRDYKGK